MSEPNVNESDPEVERRLSAIARRFPERFSPEQADEIRERVIKSIDLGSKLSAQVLENGVSPHFDPRVMSHE